MEEVRVCKYACVCVCVCMHVSTRTRKLKPIWWNWFFMQSAVFKPFSIGLSKRRSSKNANRKIPLNIHVTEKTCKEWEWERCFCISTHTCVCAQRHFGCPHSKWKATWWGRVSQVLMVWHVSSITGCLRTKYLKKANSKVSLNSIYTSDF